MSLASFRSDNARIFAFSFVIRHLLSSLLFLLTCLGAPAAEGIRYEWFPGGLLKSQSLGRGGSVQFGYTDDGTRDLESITWPAVNSAGFPDYNAEEDYSVVREIKLKTDLAGNLDEVTDPSGKRELTHEKNRLTKTEWLSGELGDYKVERSIDGNGRLDKVRLFRQGDLIHEIDYTHNGQSSQVTGFSSGGSQAYYNRGPNSQLLTAILRGTSMQLWGREASGRIISAFGAVQGFPVFSFNYSSFDGQGRRRVVQTTKGNWTYTYRNGDSGDGQLVSATSTGTELGNFAYSFDEIGRRIDFAGNGADALNRLLRFDHPQTDKPLIISADPDARLWVNGTEMLPFNGGFIHQLAHPGEDGGWVNWHVKGVLEGAGDAADGAHPDAVAELAGQVFFPPAEEDFTYDADGNRESSALWNYGWDGRNRLVRARTKNFDDPATPEAYDIKFDYDAEGRRFKKEVTRYANGTIVEQKTVYFIWDGWDLIYERHQDQFGNRLLERSYVWGPDLSSSHGGAGGAGGLHLIRETRGQTTRDYYPLYDGSGHLVGLADHTGKLVAEYWYGPFGELISASGPMADANPWRYATKYLDRETGLYYFGHRYYDPATGQWLNREPLGEDESLNLYSYCHNDPINQVDVLGLREVDIVDPNRSTRFRRINGEWHVRLVTKRIGFWHGFLGHNDEYIIRGSGRYVPASSQRGRLIGFAQLTEDGGVPTDGAELIKETFEIAKPTLETHAKATTGVCLAATTALIAAPVVSATGGVTSASAVVSQSSQMASAAYVSGSSLMAKYYAQIAATTAISRQIYNQTCPTLTRIAHHPALHGMASDGTFVAPGVKPGVLGTALQRGQAAPTLHKSTVAANRVSPQIKALSEANITDSGVTVLGRFQAPPGQLNYIQKATTGKYKGASYFDLGDAWTPLEGKAANRHFLDIVGGRGDKMIFSTPKNKITTGTSLDMEVKYLQKNYGYKWVNQWSMQKR